MASYLLAFGLIIVLGAAADDNRIPVDVTDFGRVNGLRHTVREYQKNVDVFLGIPFARPPTGDLRFRPPEPLPSADSASKEYDATELPATCYQAVDTEYEPSLVDTWNPNTALSEDCLYLNIWKPEGVSNCPVMVWIYGGGFTSGSSTLVLYDGKVLATKGQVIVVSMQYRVGPLGFLSLGSESAPGNAGLLDQQLAMRWVHDHIADFGGNPDMVTIVGESAGAASVSYHLLSAGSAELFRSAVMQSSTAGSPWAFVEPEVAKERSYKLAELLGCSRDGAIECMRKKDADVVTNKQFEVSDNSYNFVPTIDQQFIKKSPMQLINDGEFQRKNIMMGMTSHEGSYFVFYQFKEQFNASLARLDKNVTHDEYRKMVSELKMVVESSSDVVLDTVASIYSLPCGSEGSTGDVDAKSYFKSLEGMLGDVWFKCPVIHKAKSYAKENKKGGNHKVYMYAFNHHSSGNPWPRWTGDALHGYEIDHVFGVPFSDDKKHRYSNGERQLSNKMMTFWTNFVKTGDPNVDEGEQKTDITWPEYTIDDRQVILLNMAVSTQSGLRDRFCQFWSETVPALRTATMSSQGQASPKNGIISLTLSMVLSLIAVLIRDS